MRIIDKVHKKIKNFANHKWFDEILLFTVIMFIGLGTFSLGILYERQQYNKQNPIEIRYSTQAVELWEQYQNSSNQNNNFFASKNGSVVYPINCSAGNRILEENKIYFTTIDQALEEGYRKSTSC